MWCRSWKYSCRTGDAFFYDRAARIRIKEREIAAHKKRIEETKPESEKTVGERFKENSLFRRVEKSSEVVVERAVMDRQSDRIMQNILNASKLLEGRFTFEQLINLDIPTFENIVNNEFENIDVSYKNFKETGSINAYTKNETTNLDEKFLKDLGKKV